MSHYRRRKHLSLDGSIRGAEPNRFRPGIKAFPTYRGTSQGHRPVEEYDPQRAAYDSNAPEYTQPDPWFEGLTHLAPPPERIAPGLPPPPMQQDSVQYKDSQMTPELFQHLLREVSTAGSPPLDAETAPREVTDPSGEAKDQQNQAEQSMWAAPELMGEHPWFDSGQTAPETSEAMTVEATEQPELLSEMASYEATLQAMGDQQLQGLEAVIQEPTPLQAEEDPFEMERRMYDQQMQQLEQMLNPDLMSGFGPGMMGPGFGPGP